MRRLWQGWRAHAELPPRLSGPGSMVEVTEEVKTRRLARLFQAAGWVLLLSLVALAVVQDRSVLPYLLMIVIVGAIQLLIGVLRI